MSTEKMILGILCYEQENGLMIPYTIEALSTAFIAMRRAYERQHARANQLDEHLKAIREEVLHPEKSAMMRQSMRAGISGSNTEGP